MIHRNKNKLTLISKNNFIFKNEYLFLKNKKKKMTQNFFEILSKIKINYGLGKNVDNLIESFLELDPNRSQSFICDQILKDKFFIQFPPSRKYRRAFLKHLINAIGKTCEVNEEILEEYFTLLNVEKAEDKYFLVLIEENTSDENRPVIIEQHTAHIANGTTGLHVWPACFKLVNFVNKNKDIFHNK